MSYIGKEPERQPLPGTVGSDELEDGGVAEVDLSANILSMFRGHIHGLITSNNATDSDHDIDITAGVAVADNSDVFMSLDSAMTKQLDATWAAGTNAGGLFSGTIAADTWYHVFLIKNVVTGAVDAGFDTSVTAANIPSGYTAYRRIGSILTDATSNILGYTQIGDEFIWDEIWDENNQANPGTAVVTITVDYVPTGVPVLAKIGYNLYNDETSVCYAWIASGNSSPTFAASAGRALATARDASSYSKFDGGIIDVWTNENAEIKYRLSFSGATVSFYMSTHGWKDNRGKYE